MTKLRVRVGNISSAQLGTAIAAMPVGTTAVEKTIPPTANHYCFSTAEFTVVIDTNQVGSFLSQNLGTAFQACMRQPDL